MADPMNAQEQRGQMQQAQQGNDPSYAGNSTAPLQPGKTGSGSDAASNQDGAIGSAGSDNIGQNEQADYGSMSQQDA